MGADGVAALVPMFVSVISDFSPDAQVFRTLHMRKLGGAECRELH